MGQPAIKNTDLEMPEASKAYGTVLSLNLFDAVQKWAHFTVKRNDGSLFKACGNVPHVMIGSDVLMQGIWSRHKSLGAIFEIIDYRITPPTKPESIVRYISAITKLPEKYSQMMVDAWGEETISILDSHIDELDKLEGFPQNLAVMMRNNWVPVEFNDKVEDQQDSVLSLTDEQRKYLIRNNGQSLPLSEILRAEPFLPYLHFTNLNFSVVDKFARNIGCTGVAASRVQAGVIYCLRGRLHDGHSETSREQLKILTEKKVHIDGVLANDLFDDAIESLIAKNLIKDDSGAIYLSAYFNAENQIADRLVSIINSESELNDEVDPARIKSRLNELIPKKISNGLVDSLISSLKEKVLLLDKCTPSSERLILKAITELYLMMSANIAVVSPLLSDKRSLKKAINKKLSIQTIGEFVAMSPIGTPAHNASSPVDVDLLVILKSDMIDLKSMANVINASSDHTHIVFIGDTNGSYPTFAGQPFIDLLRTKGLKKVSLDELIAIEDLPAIEQAALGMIKDGVFSSELVKENDIMGSSVALLPHNPKQYDIGEFFEKAIELLILNTPEKLNYNPFSDQAFVLGSNFYMDGKSRHFVTPSQSELSEMISANLEKLNISKNKPSPTIEAVDYKIGERVIFLHEIFVPYVPKYSYGYVKELDEENSRIVIETESGDATIPYEFSDRLQSCQVNTLFKLRGNQFDWVIALVNPQSVTSWTRRVLYSTLMMARKKIILLGDVTNFKDLPAEDDVPRESSLHVRLEKALRGNQ